MSAHYFIAIPLPSALKNYFAAWQEELKGKVPYKQWTNKQDLHITLKFLGTVEKEQFIRLQKELQVVEHTKQFSTKVGSIGVFGNPDKPRILWGGVDKNEQLDILHQQVEASIAPLGFPSEERAYRPHITLAKKWDGSVKKNMVETIQDQFHEKQPLRVEEIVVYQIFPGQTPKYKVVSRHNLSGGEEDSAVD